MVTFSYAGSSALENAKRLAAGLDRPFIGDDFFGGQPDALLINRNPFDGSTLCEMAMGSEAAVDRAAAVARNALAGPWGTMAAEARAGLLRALADRVDADRELLALLETLDVGKPVQNSLAEDVPLTSAVLRWYASLLETYYDLAGPRRAGTLARVAREPHGVVGVVLPWNFPLYTLALKIAPALAAGNTIVAKPAEDTPLTALRLAQLAIDAGFPAGVLNVVPGYGAVAGRAIGLHRGIDAINFTGSTVIGRQFLHYSADSNLKEVTLECGGKNPAIVLPDVQDTDAFIEQVAIGFMANSGQICSSVSRLLLPSHLRDQAHGAIAAAMREWPMGDPLDERTRLGPLINARQAAKVRGAIEQGCQQSNDFLASDADSTGTSDLMVTPTVFFDVDEQSALWREEIFGPVLSVRFYDGLDEAIRSANDTDYGLSAYIFSNDSALTLEASSRVNAGSVSINVFGEGDFSTPFGGFKQSGFGGKDKGIHAIDQYSRIKSIWWDVSAGARTSPVAAP